MPLQISGETLERKLVTFDTFLSIGGGRKEVVGDGRDFVIQFSNKQGKMPQSKIVSTSRRQGLERLKRICRFSFPFI